MTEKTIYALGFFDGVHLGHQALLSACKQLAEKHGCKAAAVTFDLHPETRLSGAAPQLICRLPDRSRLLMQFGADTFVGFPFTDRLRKMPWQDFLKMLTEQFGAVGFVCGDDFRFGYRGAGNANLLQDYCKQQGLSCAVVPEQTLDGTRVSSTHIRKLLKNGEIETANRFLGHPHILSGIVVEGQMLGRTIDIPTANLDIPEEVLLPKNGVYACKATTQDGKTYLAVTNIGSRPTVAGDSVTVETWLLDFDGYLYSQELTLEFYTFLRPEQKFDSLEELKAEIQKNAAQTRKIFENS